MKSDFTASKPKGRLNRAQLFSCYSENLSATKTSLDRTALLLRQAISKNDSKNEQSLTKMYALLLGIWAENRLAKTIYQKRVLTHEKRGKLLRKGTQIQKWEKIVNESFKKRYKVKKLNEMSLGHTVFQQHSAIITLLKNDLEPVISLRNKLAHGQWINIFNSNPDETKKRLQHDKMNSLSNDNIISLQGKRQILYHIASLIHTCLDRKPWFKRDFDYHYRVIQQTKINMQKHSFDDYKAKMQAKFKRGRQKLLLNLTAKNETG